MGDDMNKKGERRLLKWPIILALVFFGFLAVWLAALIALRLTGNTVEDLQLWLFGEEVQTPLFAVTVPPEWALLRDPMGNYILFSNEAEILDAQQNERFTLDTLGDDGMVLEVVRLGLFDRSDPTNADPRSRVEDIAAREFFDEDDFEAAFDAGDVGDYAAARVRYVLREGDNPIMTMIMVLDVEGRAYILRLTTPEARFRSFENWTLAIAKTISPR